MNQIETVIDDRRVVATFEPVFRHLVKVELLTPYKGLEVQFVNSDEESDLYDEAQAEEFVLKSLHLLMKQIDNVRRYREVYQAFSDEYKRITDIMWAALKSVQSMSSRDKFRYHLELQSKTREEFNRRLQSQIPGITEANQEEFFVYPSQLTEILAIV